MMHPSRQEERFMMSSPSPSASSTRTTITSAPHTTPIRDGLLHRQRTDCSPFPSCCSAMRTVTVLCILLLTLPICHCDAQSTCELDFDTMYCDFNTSTGYGFIRDEIWNIECYSEEINVIKSSARPSPYGRVDVVFSDTQFIYVIRGPTVFVTTDYSFTGWNHVMTVKDLFSGFNETIVSAFYYQEQVYLYDGMQFTILNQRVYRIGNQPLWSFKRAEDVNHKLVHDKMSNMKISLVIPEEEGKNHELLLLLKGNQYYKLSSIDYCLPPGSGLSKLPDVCFWEEGKKLDTLISCVLISWKLLLLITGISFLAILITCYICCLIICYRRQRKSGTFKHEKQNCCSQDGDCYFTDDPAHMKETGKLQPNGHPKTNGHQQSNGRAHNGTSKSYPEDHDYLDNASNIIDTFDTYDEERISIDLREGTFHR